MKAGLTLSLSFLALTSIFTAQQALAADGTIRFTGSIEETACKVDASSGDVPVSLGKWGTASLASAGATTSPQTFQLKFTGCTTGTYALRLEGNTVAATGENANLIALDPAGTGKTATNVGIQVTGSDDKIVPVNSSLADGFTFAVAEGDTSTVLDLKAYYKATGVATAGAANASVGFSVEYK